MPIFCFFCLILDKYLSICNHHKKCGSIKLQWNLWCILKPLVTFHVNTSKFLQNSTFVLKKKKRFSGTSVIYLDLIFRPSATLIWETVIYAIKIYLDEKNNANLLVFDWFLQKLNIESLNTSQNSRNWLISLELLIDNNPFWYSFLTRHILISVRNNCSKVKIVGEIPLCRKLAFGIFFFEIIIFLVPTFIVYFEIWTESWKLLNISNYDPTYWKCENLTS